ncbi:unnamed protein product (macronuclear) [Paramecium tetraurelia]|uniref:Uncharacterized protein n=1 Tax=Paramecium tetraurelia TaxID=5888 RepID=A0BC87_PARTE|nr:uncharacterized protein GSPATT00004248001 [Paramecium tetraurelia]CAK56154.1 unnamed protein product [Paramecium tetraurelia]|eukprot:XP_001423552.1 hypothetical protein (macronuclear) [Paramecium tetraurelia strain d4-2]
MNDFGINNNRFQQKAVNRKQDSVERQNNLEKQQPNKIWQQSQNDSQFTQDRKESMTVIGTPTPIMECHVPVFEPAKFINDITNKKK